MKEKENDTFGRQHSECQLNNVSGVHKTSRRKEIRKRLTDYCFTIVLGPGWIPRFVVERKSYCCQPSLYFVIIIFPCCLIWSILSQLETYISYCAVN